MIISRTAGKTIVLQFLDSAVYGQFQKNGPKCDIGLKH